MEFSDCGLQNNNQIWAVKPKQTDFFEFLAILYAGHETKFTRKLPFV